ncbi:DUF523 domain-containing protein [Listeria ivanovii]|uniref:Uncharacterized protein n=1 Tax=Listeria ivanovii (strain ATCC BAA-678 / PAM 55) TaxID=881621 RepID=G2ZEG6_LISIP|nr:DUF523 domain-containing protein [Listeria ivanovii]MBC1760441.1 DUF523 domain-containing protein [Listeria ivanovii]MBK3913778.1 DUF523 domain-containing protein [Listeria ivanovii subsp. ivanovii]MBK3921384.1 DUF523 domain-containing protein [Listeria ivanovii subsp. ivanovii]MBK3926548.1 DUF523 domain-containing protein [Listeria ivanovii subsp. ivanovii]MCJ1722046.1 DUF523 domain-containing protein [Listeria ivanovii]
MIAVSACLAGIACRYDGQDKEITEIKQLVESGEGIPFCPEVIGGLSTPRNPAEIVGGDGRDVWCGRAKVIDSEGNNVTEEYKRGATLTLTKMKELKITKIIMKENSPSCGSCTIYDGTFSGKTKDGTGVAAALFIANGIEVISEFTI